MVVTDETARPSSLGRRVLALLVVLAAAWVLLHFLVHLAVAIASTLVVVLALVALVWALRVIL